MTNHFDLPDVDEYFRALQVIDQPVIDWLIGHGVPTTALCSRSHACVKMARGNCAADGWFEIDERAHHQIAFLVEDNAGAIDVGFWNPRGGALASLNHVAFALGENEIDNSAATIFGGALRIWPSPLDWLRSGRQGIVILRPELCWGQLQHLTRVEVSDNAQATDLKRQLRPRHVPKVLVRAMEAAA